MTSAASFDAVVGVRIFGRDFVSLTGSARVTGAMQSGASVPPHTPPTFTLLSVTRRLLLGRGDGRGVTASMALLLAGAADGVDVAP